MKSLPNKQGAELNETADFLSLSLEHIDLSKFFMYLTAIYFFQLES